MGYLVMGDVSVWDGEVPNWHYCDGMLEAWERVGQMIGEHNEKLGGFWDVWVREALPIGCDDAVWYEHVAVCGESSWFVATDGLTDDILDGSDDDVLMFAVSDVKHEISVKDN